MHSKIKARFRREVVRRRFLKGGKMKPKIHVFFTPKPADFRTQGGLQYTEPVVLLGATIRRWPMEGLVLWGRRPHNGGLNAYKFNHRGNRWELDISEGYRPCYAEARKAFSDPDLMFAAGVVMQTINPHGTYPMCDCCRKK